MSTTCRGGGAIPAIYDTYLGPLLYDHPARVIATRLRIGPWARVLELACGTGIATQALHAATSPETHIVATDLDPGMLAEAKRRRDDAPRVEYMLADALALPFEDASFDAVVCQFGLMDFPDRRQGLSEALRVLRPGGQLLFSTWGALEVNPLMGCVDAFLRSRFPEAPPCFLERLCGMHSGAALTRLAVRSGAHNVRVDEVRHRVRVTSARHVARGLLCGTTGFHEMSRRVGPSVEALVSATQAALLGRFGPAPFETEFCAVFVEAERPLA